MSRSIFPTLAVLALFCASTTLNAQVKPLKENVLLLLDHLPPTCTSLDEAKAKCGQADGRCSNEAIIAPFTQLHTAKVTERTTGAAGMSASQEALMQKMSDPAFQAEMQKMTPDQLVALSTQLQTGALPNSGIPKPEETAMAEEFDRINQGIVEFSMQYTTEYAQLRSAYEERRKAIEQARWEEVKKCPTETSGEVTFTSPACCAEVEKKYDAQWLAAAQEWLPKANDVVKRYRTAVLQRYAEAERRMAALGYGDGCGIQMFYDMIGTTQTYILGHAEAAADMAAQTWQVACENKLGLDGQMICP